MPETNIINGLIGNAAWDLTKWVILITCGGLLAKIIGIKKHKLSDSWLSFKINHSRSYREKHYKKEYIIETANENKTIIHKIYENKIWYKDTDTKNYYPTNELYFFYQHPSGYIQQLKTVGEHSSNIQIADIDNDQRLEIQIQYKCGAHTTVLDVYRVNNAGGIHKLTKNGIGSNSANIKVIQAKDFDPCIILVQNVINNKSIQTETWHLLKDKFVLINRSEKNIY